MPYIKFEVRNNPEYFTQTSSSLTQGNKIRIYRKDVYKSIGPSDGSGSNIIDTIRMNDIGFNNN